MRNRADFGKYREAEHSQRFHVSLRRLCDTTPCAPSLHEMHLPALHLAPQVIAGVCQWRNFVLRAKKQTSLNLKTATSAIRPAARHAGREGVSSSEDRRTFPGRSVPTAHCPCKYGMNRKCSGRVAAAAQRRTTQRGPWPLLRRPWESQATLARFQDPRGSVPWDHPQTAHSGGGPAASL